MREAQRSSGESKKPQPEGSEKGPVEPLALPAGVRMAFSAAPPRGGAGAPGGIEDDALQAHQHAHMAHELRAEGAVDSLRRPFGGAADGARIYAGPEAARIADAHGASAVTHGKDVYFAGGAFRPETPPGRALLAHELAHAAQQSTNGGGAPGAAHEHQANQAAFAALQGRPVGLLSRVGLSLQRCSGFDASNPDHVARAQRLAALFEERRRLRASGAPDDQIQGVQTRIDDAIAELRRAGISQSEQEIEEAVRPYTPVSDAGTSTPDAQAPATTTPPVPAGASAPLIGDLGGVQWRPDGGKTLLIYGSNGIGFARSDGLMLTAAVDRPGPAADPALASQGPTGRTPVAPPAPEAMLGVPGQRRSASSLVTIGTEGGRRLGMVVDVGGAATSPARPGVSCVPFDNIIALQARMGIGEITAIAITHLHGDHVANIVEFIARLRLPPGRVFIADEWTQHQVLRELRATTDARLTAVGWGPTATLGTVDTSGGTGMSRFTVSGTLTVDVLFAPTSMRAHGQAIADEQNARSRRAAGTASDADVRAAAGATSSSADAASLVYVVRNPLARTGVMYLQDMRGDTVSEIQRAMETTRAGSFAEALRGITVLNGLGHHFGLASGEAAGDVGGMRTLLSTLMQVNHQLTIICQADRRSFTAGTQSSPLLRFARAIGARVVLVLEGTSDAIIDSDMRVQLRGPDVLDAAGEQTARGALERIAQLEQARLTLQNRGDFGNRELGLEGTAAQSLAAVQAEIARLTALHAELTARAALTFHEETTGAAPTARATQRILGTTAAGTPAAPPRALADILADLAGTSGPQFSEAVRARLQAQASLRSTFGLESTLGGTPRAVADAMSTLPPLVRDQINESYARIRAGVLAEGAFAEEPLAALETEVRVLRAQLDTAQQALDAAARAPITQQIAELDRALGRITQERALLVSHREVTSARAALGAPGEGTSMSTVRLVDALSHHAELVNRALADLPADAPPSQRQWLQEEMSRANAAINEALGAGPAMRSRAPGTGATISTRVVPMPRLTARVGDVSGRALGGLMVYHSIEGLDHAVEAFQLDEASLAQTTARIAQGAGGVYVGMRMLRGYQVGTGSFAILSAIDVFGTALGTYQTDEEWSRAFWTSVTRNSFQLAFLGLSQIATRLLVPRLGPIGVAIALALTLVVDPLLDFLGVYDFIERSTGFLPADVIDVQIALRRRIDDFRIAIGALQIAKRNESDLAQMGSADPSGLRARARSEVATHQADAESRRASILEEFDEAYDEARVAYAGLQELDQLRQYFQQLVEDAQLTSTASAETRTHFEEVDRTLGLGGMDDEAIDDLDQWSRIRGELDDLESELDDDPGAVDWDDVREAQENLRVMFGNARYRLDPSSSGGGLRQRPLLPDGPARTRYQQRLSELEARYYAANRWAMRQMRSEQQAVVSTYPSGATRPDQGTPEFAREGDALIPVAPGQEYASQLRFLEDATAEYTRLLRVQPPLPSNLTVTRLYSDFLVAGVEYRSFVARNSAFRSGLERLRSAEAILVETQTRAREAGQSLDSTQRQAQMLAVLRSRSVMDDRRVVYGYLFPEEAERLLGGGQVSDDRTALALATRAGPEPLTPHEVFAIQSGALGDVHLSSGGRGIDIRPDLLPWARANRGLLRRYVGTWGATDIFVASWGGTRLTAADNAVVGLTGVRRDTTDGRYGHTTEERVIALNDRARQVFGAAPQFVLTNELQPVNEEDLAARP